MNKQEKRTVRRVKTHPPSTPPIFFFTAQIMKFFIKDFFSKYDQIRSFLRIWSHLLKKSLMENFIFCAVFVLKLKNLKLRPVNEFR